jgi:rod shape-determining protein MreD
MAIVVSFPVLGLALILQLAIFSRLTLLSGSADLILLILAAWGLQERTKFAWFWAILAGILVGYVSGLPMVVPLAAYLFVIGAARLLQRRIWQAPLLAMFAVSFIGTLIMNILSYISLRLLGDPLPLGDSFSLIVLPSLLLNLLLSIPIYSLVGDLAHWLFPAEVDV